MSTWKRPFPHPYKLAVRPHIVFLSCGGSLWRPCRSRLGLRPSRAHAYRYARRTHSRAHTPHTWASRAACPIKVSMRLVRGREVLLAGRHGCGVVQRPASPGRGWGGGGEACGASVHEAQPGARSQYFCPTLRFIIHVVVCASRQLDTWLDVAGAAVVACVSRTDVESDRKRNTAVNGADELDGADLSK